MKFLCKLVVVAILAATPAWADSLPQSPLPKETIKQQYPTITLYSVSWCPHCKAAKEYLTSHNIPFINKDVELDPKAFEELTEVYKSQSVPVMVIGNDKKVLRGFTPQALEKALAEARKK